MTSIEFSSPTRVVRGRDAVDRTGELARELEAERIFLVTDPGLCAAGHAERVEASLLQSALEVRRFDSVRENPTTKDVDACRTALGDWDVQLLVGLGGGSSIDVAKGCAFLHAGGGRTMIEVVIIKVVLAGLVFFAILNLAGIHTWVERKQSALIQDRIGANRADIFGFRMLGLFHVIADGIKMFTK